MIREFTALLRGENTLKIQFLKNLSYFFIANKIWETRKQKTWGSISILNSRNIRGKRFLMICVKNEKLCNKILFDTFFPNISRKIFIFLNSARKNELSSALLIWLFYVVNIIYYINGRVYRYRRQVRCIEDYLRFLV